MRVPAIILAAGASRRLGRPKQLLLAGGEALLARTIRVVSEAGAGPVLVVLGANRESIAEGLDLSLVHAVANAGWESGIASSIRAGIEELLRLHAEVDAVMILVCDQPRLSADHLQSLMDRYAEANDPAIVASRYAGIAGIPAIFPASQFPRLLALEGDAGARFLLRNPECPMTAVDFAGGEDDIDTPEDLARLRS
jgi:CTP:molybdopterin cytidylyltransferase MocA